MPPTLILEHLSRTRMLGVSMSFFYYVLYRMSTHLRHLASTNSGMRVTQGFA